MDFEKSLSIHSPLENARRQLQTVNFQLGYYLRASFFLHPFSWHPMMIASSPPVQGCFLRNDAVLTQRRDDILAMRKNKIKLSLKRVARREISSHTRINWENSHGQTWKEQCLILITMLMQRVQCLFNGFFSIAMRWSLNNEWYSKYAVKSVNLCIGYV